MTVLVSDHEAAEFQIVGNRIRTARKTLTLDVERADVGLLKELNNKVLWECGFESIGVHECWLLFKSHLFKSTMLSHLPFYKVAYICVRMD